jgi:hypothetical protein
MKSETRRWSVVCVLVILSSVMLFYIFHLWLSCSVWRTEAMGCSSYAGSVSASRDFKAGRLRLLEAKPGGEYQDTGKVDGPFQVWAWPYYGNPFPLQKQQEMMATNFARAYSSRMRHLYANGASLDDTGMETVSEEITDEQGQASE